MKMTKRLMTLMAIAAIAMTAAMPMQAKKKATKATKATTQVVYTGDIAKKVIGYNGTTPLNITIKKGKIEKIEALPNQEGPAYMQRATKKVFAQYEGLTVVEALKLKPDVATGATYTSEALIKNIQMGLQQAGGKAKADKKSNKKVAKKRKH